MVSTARHPGTRTWKRLFDVTGAGAVLVICLPVIAVVAVLVRIKLGSPILFRQQRPGMGERIFTLYKFRTMTSARDENGELLPNHLRITRFGNLLRKTSLDELPQLWNVLIGDMSLVGPRPLLPRYLPIYTERQRRRHEVRPGITGWAQVNGRNSISWHEKLELDVWYVENISFWLDVRILWLTLLKVLKREGINAGEAVTMEPFNGMN